MIEMNIINEGEGYRRVIAVVRDESTGQIIQTYNQLFEKVIFDAIKEKIKNEMAGGN